MNFYTKPILWLLMPIISLGSAFASTQLVDSEESQADVIQARLVALDQAKLSSPMPGKINKIYYSPGEKFERDALLVSFDCHEQKHNLEEANALLKKESVKLKAMEKLVSLKAGSQTDLESSKADYVSAKVAMNKAVIDVNKCTMKAPYSGIVISTEAHVHETVKKDQPLLQIVSNENQNLEVRLYVPSPWINWLKIGEKFTVKFDENSTPQVAEVTKIGGQVDTVSKTIEVFAKIVRSSGILLAGMSGEAAFSIPPVI